MTEVLLPKAVVLGAVLLVQVTLRLQSSSARSPKKATRKSQSRTEFLVELRKRGGQLWHPFLQLGRQMLCRRGISNVASRSSPSQNLEEPCRNGHLLWGQSKSGGVVEATCSPWRSRRKRASGESHVPVLCIARRCVETSLLTGCRTDNCTYIDQLGKYDVHKGHP